MTYTFVPFHALHGREAIVVDGHRSRGLVLSHWKESATPVELRGDTSADCVLNALKAGAPGLDIPIITATHFDIDGFVGVWAIMNRELALQHEGVLREMALIGDFRELNLLKPDAETALKLVCWINALEKAVYYAPYGAAHNELLECAQKFDYFLDEFAAVVKNPDDFKKTWQPEFEQVLKDYETAHSDKTLLRTFPHLGLVAIQTPEPLHYYALFSRSLGYDIVCGMYSDNRYELEYKYTTWVDITSRHTLPRISMEPLAAKLNALEGSGRTWTFESISDTGPILRLDGDYLTKEERFQNPFEREIFSSTIGPEEFLKIVVEYYSAAFKNIEPKENWTWKEMRELANIEL
jgi:hypothetical protein